MKYSPVHGSGGSPALVGDSLIFSCDGADSPFVIASTAGNRLQRWADGARAEQ